MQNFQTISETKLPTTCSSQIPCFNKRQSASHCFKQKSLSYMPQEALTIRKIFYGDYVKTCIKKLRCSINFLIKKLKKPHNSQMHDPLISEEF